jgi:hypothetical protein
MRQFIYRIFNIKENKYTMTGSLYGCEGTAHLAQCFNRNETCLLYTSDAADDRLAV